MHSLRLERTASRIARAMMQFVCMICTQCHFIHSTLLSKMTSFRLRTIKCRLDTRRYTPVVNIVVYYVTNYK